MPSERYKASSARVRLCACAQGHTHTGEHAQGRVGVRELSISISSVVEAVGEADDVLFEVLKEIHEVLPHRKNATVWREGEKGESGIRPGASKAPAR